MSIILLLLYIIVLYVYMCIKVYSIGPVSGAGTNLKVGNTVEKKLLCLPLF